MVIRPTMFDAFVNSLSKPHTVKRAAKKIAAELTKEKQQQIETTAHQILKEAGVNADVSVRFKSLDSTEKKIVRYLKENFDTYENKRDDVLAIIFGKKGVGEIVGDSAGIRYTAADSDIDKIMRAIYNHTKKNPNFSVSTVENYHGKGIKPYAQQDVCDDFAQLIFKDIFDKKRNTIAVDAEKKTGYTRVNINSKTHDINTEVQVGGKFTNPWGDVEHYRYDMSLGKNVDTSKLNEEQLKLFNEYAKEYKKLLQKPNAHKKYMQEYMSKIWGALKRSEEKNLASPVFPELPEGFAPILKAETLFKLAH